MKRIFSVFTVIIIAALFSAPLSVYAAEAPEAPEIGSRYAAVYVKHEDKLVYSKSADETVPPASAAKMMTGILAVLHYKDPDAPVTATKQALEAVRQGSLVLGIKEGEVHSARELIYAVVTGGYADAALILACGVSGSVRDFTALMNETAKELGASDTVFANPTGDDAGNAKTTPLDIAKIASYALDLPLFMQAANAPSYVIKQTDKSEKYTVYPRNMLRVPSSADYYLDGVSGINAGVTSKAGYCLVTSAESSGYTYIYVVWGGKSSGGKISTYTDVKQLIKYASKLGYSYKTVVDTFFVCAELPVSLASGQSHVILVPKEEVRVFLPAHVDPKKDMTYSVSLTVDSLTAPVEKGMVCGSIVFSFDGEKVVEEDIVTKEYIPKSSFEEARLAFGNFLKSRAFILSAVSVVLLLTAFFTIRYIIMIKKRRG